MLQAPGFGVHRPRILESETLSGPNPPPTRKTDGFVVPSPSIKNKRIQFESNPEVPAYIYATPWYNNWQQNFAVGMPIFANSKVTPPNVNSVLAGSLAVVNYYLEEGARTIYKAQLAPKKQKRELVNEFKTREHLYASDVADLMDKWRHFGVIKSIMGKATESGFATAGSADALVVNCNVTATTNILNYWGPRVSRGDRLYFYVGLKRNVNKHFYDPNGAAVGLSLHSPEFFFQIIPVSYGCASGRPSHNRNFLDLQSPFRDDLDFMATNLAIDQLEMEITPDGGFIPKPLNLSTESIKTQSLVCDLYNFGGLIPMGIVSQGSKGKTNPGEYDLQMVIRDDRKAQTLERIEVHMGC